MSGLLDGLKVVELAHVVAAPHAAQVLAMHGAEVVKVEPPAGDMARRLGPRLPGGSSGTYAAFNRHKRVVRHDIREPAGREAIVELVRDADVFITSVDAGLLAAHRLDSASLAELNSGLVYAEVSAFGSGGPLGTDGLAQAHSGMASLTGEEDGQALRTGVSAVDVATGFTVAFGILAALEGRRRTGRGRLVQVSLEDVALALSGNQIAMYSLAPDQIHRMGNRSSSACTPMLDVADGRVAITIMHDRHWGQLCRALGRPELAADPRFGDEEARRVGQPEIEAIFNPLVAGASRAELVGRLRAARVPAAAERSLAEVLADRELWERGALYTETFDGVEVTQVGSPLRGLS
jgi:crotonobetainyl-CoA:carnitine CoA-transferase CaiB-like acyl-CoA transferase